MSVSDASCPAWNRTLPERSWKASPSVSAHLDQPNSAIEQHHQADLPLNEPLPGAGASLWLSSIPSEALGTVLSRHEFRACLRLRYGLMPDGVTALSECGAANDLLHPLICSHGGAIIRGHNKVRDFLAGLCSQLAPASIEPMLHPLAPGESFRLKSATTDPAARSDVLSLEGFFTPYRWTFIDVCIFARKQIRHAQTRLFQALHAEEQAKGRMCQERINSVENSDFVPFILSDSGLVGRQARTFLTELSDRLSVSRSEKRSVVRSLIMTDLSFIIQRRRLDCYFAPRGKSQVPKGSFLTLSAPYAAFLDRKNV